MKTLFVLFITSSAFALDCPQSLDLSFRQFVVTDAQSVPDTPGFQPVLDLIKSGKPAVAHYEQTQKYDQYMYRACEYADPKDSWRTVEIQFPITLNGEVEKAMITATLTLNGTPDRIYIDTTLEQVTSMSIAFGNEPSYFGIYYPSTCKDDQWNDIPCEVGTALGSGRLFNK
jgi:hypothetical protein